MVGNILQVTSESGVSQTTTSQSASSRAQGQVVPLTITVSNLSGATVVLRRQPPRSRASRSLGRRGG